MPTIDEDITTGPLPTDALERGYVCAYCGQPPTHLVSVITDLSLFGFCCNEPTHWAWLVDSVQRELTR